MGRPKLIERWAAAPAVLAAVALAVSGCGGGSSGQKRVAPDPANNTQAAQYVTDRDIAATPKHSPERTIMTWWQLVQFKDVKDSQALFTRKSQRILKRADYASLAVRYLGPWMRNGKPKILRVRSVTPTHAIVFTQLLFNIPVGSDLVRQDSDSLAFGLDRSGRDWLISDPVWVIQQGNVLLQQDQQQQQAQQQRNATPQQRGAPQK